MEGEPLNLSSQEYNLLYSVYSLPNIVLPLVAGIITDKLGMKLTIFIFCTLVTIGQVIFCIGGVNQNFFMMCAGRFVFGIGSECQFVVK